MVPPMRGAVHVGGASVGDLLAAFLPLTTVVLAGFWFGVRSAVPKRPGSGGEDGDESGPGRGPWRGPRPPKHPPDPDPHWWPDFEREFAAYVARGRRERAGTVRTGSPQRVTTIAGPS